MKKYLLLLVGLATVLLSCEESTTLEQQEGTLLQQLTHNDNFQKLVDIRQREMCILAETDRIMEKEMFTLSEKGGEEALDLYVKKYEAALDEMDQTINDLLLAYLESPQTDKHRTVALTDISNVIRQSTLSEETQQVQIAYHQLLLEGQEGQIRENLYQEFPELQDDKNLLTSIFLEYIQTEELPTCLDLVNAMEIAKK